MRQLALSIETTGSEISTGNRVIEIGCVELVDRELTGRQFHVYLNPHHPVDERFIDQHGITNEFLNDKPTFGEIADDLLAFFSKDELVTYNAPYVLGFLQHELMLLEKSKTYNLDNEVVDVLSIGNERHPEQNNSFYELCQRYYVDTTQTELFGALKRAELIADLHLALVNESTKIITSDLSSYELGENLVVVNNFAEFDKAIDGISKTALCRGVSNHEYPLLPSLFRHTDVESADAREYNLMWVFKTHAKAHLKNIPSTEIEWLTIAQHHGLPTRLLDWSLSPLVACFFAVQSLSSSDGSVYIYDIKKFKKEEEIGLSKLKEIVAFFPSHATKRVTAQSGMFTVHPSKKMKLESKLVKKILIPAKRKKYFMEKLIKFGIHQGTLFPDLDGISRYVKYLNKYR